MPRRRVWALASLPLLGCGGLQAGPPPEPFSLRCTLADGAVLQLRLDPRRQQVERLDPASGAVINTIRTTDPPPAELGGGILDASTVRISTREIAWEETMYRPKYSRDRHRIDPVTLFYSSETEAQSDTEPELVVYKQSGRCRRLISAPQP